MTRWMAGTLIWCKTLFTFCDETLAHLKDEDLLSWPEKTNFNGLCDQMNREKRYT